MYDKPVNLDFINTYVSPDFNMLMKSGAAMQGRADQAEKSKGEIEDAFSNINALSWAKEDVQKRDAIIKGYQDRIDKEIKKVGGSYSKLLPFIKDLNREVQQDLKRGQAAQLNANYAAWNKALAEQQELYKENKIGKEEFDLRRAHLQSDYINQGGVGEVENLQGINTMDAIIRPGDIGKELLSIANNIEKMSVTQLQNWVRDNEIGRGALYNKKSISTVKRSKEKIQKLASEYMMKDPKYRSYFKQIADDKKWNYQNQLASVGVTSWTEEREKYGGGFSEKELEYFKNNNYTDEQIENYSENKWYQETKYSDVNKLAKTAGEIKEVRDYKETERSWTDNELQAKRAADNVSDSQYLMTQTPTLNMSDGKSWSTKMQEHSTNKDAVNTQKTQIFNKLKNMNLFGSTSSSPIITAIKDLWNGEYEEGSFTRNIEAKRKKSEEDLSSFKNMLTGNSTTSEYSDFKTKALESYPNATDEQLLTYYEKTTDKSPYELNANGEPLTNRDNMINMYAKTNGISINDASVYVDNLEKDLEVYNSNAASLKTTDAQIKGFKDNAFQNTSEKDWRNAYNGYADKIKDINYANRRGKGEYKDMIPLSMEEFKEGIRNASTKEEFQAFLNGASATNLGEVKQGENTFSEIERDAANINTSARKVEIANEELLGMWDKIDAEIDLSDAKVPTFYTQMSGAWEKGTPNAYLNDLIHPTDIMKSSSLLLGEIPTDLHTVFGIEGKVDLDDYEIKANLIVEEGNASYYTKMWDKDGKYLGSKLLHVPGLDANVEAMHKRNLNSNRKDLVTNAKTYFGMKEMSKNTTIEDLTLMQTGNKLPLFIENTEVAEVIKAAPSVGFPNGAFQIIVKDPDTREENVFRTVGKQSAVGTAMFELEQLIRN